MNTILKNLSEVIPATKLSTMRKISDLHKYLPLKVAGVELRLDSNELRGKTAASRQGGFLTLTNTPQIQELVKEYDPRDIHAYVEKELNLDYDPELREFEGDLESKLLAPRGMRNPFHLLEQALIAGPTGDSMKGNPEPFDWDILYECIDDLVAIIRQRIGKRKLTPKHLVPSTPSSVKDTLRVSHVLPNSFAEDVFSDPGITGTAKGKHLRRAITGAERFLKPTDRLPLWPAVAFARGDRVGTWPLVLDTEEARSTMVHEMKDRLIAGQSFYLQLLDGIFTQRLSEEMAAANIPEIDMREPWLLSNWFQEGMRIVGSEPNCKSIGSDESAWDQHFTPQLWYAGFAVYKALFADDADIVVARSDLPLICSESDAELFGRLAPGADTVMNLTALDGEEERLIPVELVKIRLKTDDVLRRVFAGASGSGFRFGELLVDGFTHVVNSPRHGNVQLGWSMRSGNWMTFLMNSLGNWIKLAYISKASRNAALRAQYEQMFGVPSPRLKLRWLVVRGDDAGQVWQYLDGFEQSIATTLANWLTLLGGSANPDKQDTSDEFGRWRLGFAQLFTSEKYPRGVSSGIRAIARTIWNERDEVVLDDPDSGEDMRPYIRLMNMTGRLSNLWGLWDRAVHPRAEEITSIIQDLDYRDRILPPLTDEEREKAARAFALRQFRRGTIRAESIDEVVRSFWNTDLAVFTQKRRDSLEKLNGQWSPLARTPDARDAWRTP
uniref:RdRp n=1 Tax=viral metagenome TaxID=1070528 RepID=A0A2V0RA56_9ZZZZ